MWDRLQAARLMVTEFPEYSNARGNARDRGKGNREYRKDLRWYVKYGWPTQEATRNWRAVCIERCKHGSGRGGWKRTGLDTT